MTDDFIYLDYNATTPVDPRVGQAMEPFLLGFYGNPSSAHRLGREARAAVDHARSQVATCLGCRPEEVLFTSGGSESNNTAIRGVVAALEGGHVITSAIDTLPSSRWSGPSRRKDALPRPLSVSTTVAESIPRTSRVPSGLTPRSSPYARQQRGRNPPTGG